MTKVVVGEAHRFIVSAINFTLDLSVCRFFRNYFLKHCGESKFDTQAAEGVGLDTGGPIRVIFTRTNCLGSYSDVPTGWNSQGG
jgi:hypothetical protein